METENRNELVEIFGKLFGEAVANEINKYDSRKVNEAEYSEDVKNIKIIIDAAVEKICGSIESAKKEILERIDSRRLIDLTDPIRPLIYPNPYRTTPDPMSPFGPVTFSGSNDDRVTMTTTSDQNFPTTPSFTAEDIDDILYSMFGQ